MRKIGNQFSGFIFMKESTILRQRIDWQKKAWNSSVPSIPSEATELLQGPADTGLASYLEASQPLMKVPHKVKGPLYLRDFAKRLTNSLLFWEILFWWLWWPAFWSPLHGCRLAGVTARSPYLRRPFGNAFTVSIIHALDISRYRYSYGPPLLLAMAALIVFTLLVAGLATQRCSSRRFTIQNP